MTASPFAILKTAIANFIEDQAMAWAAAIAFYTALSFAPLIILLIAISEWLGPETRAGVIDAVARQLGPQAGDVIQTVVNNADQTPGRGILPFVLGLAVALFSASAVFAQLQAALNAIWHIRPRPGNGVVLWLRKRLLSMGMVAGLAFLLIASLVVAALIDFLVPSNPGWARLSSLILSLVIYTPLFMAIFRFLPDAQIAWRDVLEGAAATTVLFLLGKSLLGLYLSTFSVGSAYGAAGSLVLLLVWVYYSAIILLLGAELTQAWSKARGRGIQPEPQAEMANDQ